MTTSTVTPEIAAFARAVRDALGDLPEEEREELTGGLEADLTEAYAEDLARELPDPAEYAAELRAAAGLPPAGAPRRAGVVSELLAGWATTRRDIGEAIRRNAALDQTVGFLDTIRPAWWVLRAWIAMWVVAEFVGAYRAWWPAGAWWTVLIAFVVVSVQWGRGRWRFPGLRGLIAAGNALATILLFAMISSAFANAGPETVYLPASEESQPGLWSNGRPVENIYVYDAAGNKLSGVQLFDVDGNPIEPVRDVERTGVEPQPVALETGAEVYNVFPLNLEWKTWDDETGDLVADTERVDPDKVAAYRDGPFLKVPALASPTAAPAPAPTAGAAR